MKKIIKLIQRYRFNKERNIIISCINNKTVLPIKLQHKILKLALIYLEENTYYIHIAIKTVIETYDIEFIPYDNYNTLSIIIPSFNKQHFISFCRYHNYTHDTIRPNGWDYNKKAKIEFLKYLIKTYE